MWCTQLSRKATFFDTCELFIVGVPSNSSLLWSQKQSVLSLKFLSDHWTINFSSFGPGINDPNQELLVRKMNTCSNYIYYINWRKKSARHGRLLDSHKTTSPRTHTFNSILDWDPGSNKPMSCQISIDNQLPACCMSHSRKCPMGLSFNVAGGLE